MSHEVKPIISATPTPSSSRPYGAHLPNAAPWPFPGDDEEELAIAPAAGNSNVWAVKIPRFLQERWEQVRRAGVHLGTLVVDNNQNPPRVTLKLPEEQSRTVPDGTGPRSIYETDVPDLYDVNIPLERSRNTWVFSEKAKQYGAGSRTGAAGGAENGSAVRAGKMGKRKRERAYPRLIAQVQHECTVNPIRNAKYLKILAQRRLEGEQSRRPIVHVTERNATQSEINQLNAGLTNLTSTFGNSLVSKDRSTRDKMVRGDRTELTNRLFTLFREKPYWGIRALRAVVEQPEGWIREVLEDIADLVRDGQYSGLYRLKEIWREEGGGVKREAGAGEAKSEGDVDMDDNEDDEDDDEDDEDEDDFEEIVAG